MRTRPDVILFVTDEQRHDWLGRSSGGFFETPALDALAAKGVEFVDAYASATVCVPARSSLLTGLHHRRTTQVDGGLALQSGHWTIARELRDAGYQTALVGRMHFLPVRADHGFDVMRMCENVGPNSGYGLDDPYLDDYRVWIADQGLPDLRRFDLDERGEPVSTMTGLPRVFPGGHDLHPTGWIEREALEVLRSRDRRRPMLLVVSFPHPHAPYDPPEPYASMYDVRDTVLPADGWEVNEVLYGPFRDALEQFRAHAFSQQAGGPDRMREILTFIRALVRQLDDSIGRILAEVDLDSTYVWFTSDHGDYGGHRGLSTKLPWLPFDDLLRVPLLVAGPGIAPRRSSAPVQHSSFVATVLDHTGVTVPPGTFDFPSLRPVLEGTDRALGRDHARLSLWGWPFIRRGDLKMVFDPPTDQQLLFDLGRDPGETVSFHDDPAYRHQARELWQLMAEQVVRGIDPDLSIGRLPVVPAGMGSRPAGP